MEKINAENKKENIANKKPILKTSFASILKFNIAVALILILSVLVYAGDVVVQSGRIDVDGKLFVNDAGNVGIGTTGPNVALQIGSATNNNKKLRIVSDNINADIIAVRESSDAYGWNLGLETTGGDMVFQRVVNNVASETMRILRSNGNVGIGTTGPGAPLHVNGSVSDLIVLSSAPPQAAGIQYRDGSTAVWRVGRGASDGGQDFQFYDWTSPAGLRMTIKASTGNVGIGTTGPGYKLDVYTSTNADGLRVGAGVTSAESSANIVLRPSSANANQRNWLISTYYDAIGDFAIRSSNAALGDPYAAGTTRLTITNSGNVGIGITNPSSPLTIEGTTGEKFIEFQDTGTFGSRGIYLDDTCTDISSYDGSICIKWGGSNANVYVNTCTSCPSATWTALK